MTQDQTQPGDDVTARSFSHWLATVQNGVFNAALSEAMQDMIAELHDLKLAGAAPKGKIKIELDFALDGRMVTVTPKHKVITPEIKPDPAHYFVNAENCLVQQDPQQSRFDFRDVNTRPSDVRTV